jgi:hypothetical protein
MKNTFRIVRSSARFSLAALALPALVACGDMTAVDGNTPEPDAEPDTIVEPDPEPEVVEPEGPVAMVYTTNPMDGLEEVVLVPPTTDDGSLTGEYVNAINCTNQPGGTSLGFGASLCKEEKTAFPDEDGNYSHILPPEQESGEDPFAEVQMYHHVNMVHAYFKQTHGFSDLDFPLDAIVNLTINFGGSWQSFPNAAFIPPEAFQQFGLPPRDNGAIMFGQDAIDFSYDASVIYHEYTHALVGTGRLTGAFLDGYGMNNTPGALNEGVADYFASTMLDDSRLGIYALGVQFRNLSSPRRCPDNLTSQIHADGKIIGSALWEARAVLGPDAVDGVVFGAVMSATTTTGLEQFGQLLIAEADANLSAEDAATFEEVMVDFGVVGCDRARTWGTVNLAQTEGVPHAVEGSQSLGMQLPNGVPGYHGWKVTIPEGQVAEISWTMQAGGGFFGGGGEITPLGLAVRSGQPVTVSGSGGLFADELVDAPALDNDTQTLQIGGACVPAGGGDVYFTFRNSAAGASNVVYTTLDLRSDFNPDLAQVTCD